MKVTMSPDRKYMTLEAENSIEEFSFENMRLPIKAEIDWTGISFKGENQFGIKVTCAQSL
jgi:hypothetical protein